MTASGAFTTLGIKTCKHCMACRLQVLGEALLINQIPTLWVDHWSGPDQPMPYCSAVAKKAARLEQWVAAACAQQLWQQPVNLADLFLPGKH